MLVLINDGFVLHGSYRSAYVVFVCLFLSYFWVILDTCCPGMFGFFLPPCHRRGNGPLISYLKDAIKPVSNSSDVGMLHFVVNGLYLINIITIKISYKFKFLILNLRKT